MRPIGDTPERRACAEILRLSEQSEERYEAAVTPAVDPDALGIYRVLLRQILRGIDLILKIAAAHVPVDRGSPVAAVAVGCAVIQVEHHIAFRREILVEHVLARIL